MNWVLVKDRLPEKSEEVIAVSCIDDIPYAIMNVNYSAKYKRFNCQDWYSSEEAEKSGFQSVIAWCPMGELESEIKMLMEG